MEHITDWLNSMKERMNGTMDPLRAQDNIDRARLAGNWPTTVKRDMTDTDISVNEVAAAATVSTVIESHAEAKLIEQTKFDPAHPETAYQIPQNRRLMQTYEDGASEAEGWVDYPENKVQVMVINTEGQVAMRSRKHTAQTLTTYPRSMESGVFQFAEVNVSKDADLSLALPNATVTQEGIGSGKYHKRTTLVAETSDPSYLAEGGYEWFSVKTPEEVDKLASGIMDDCDPSVIAALYRRKLFLQGKQVPARLNTLNKPQAPTIHSGPMEPTTGNWFTFRDFPDGEVAVSGNESFAVAFLNKDLILLMREKTPALLYDEKITSVSGGWSGKKKQKQADGSVIKVPENETEAGVRELQEEVGFTGEGTRIGVMRPNPDVLTTASVVNIVTNVLPYTGEAHGDEVTKIKPVGFTRAQFDQAIIQQEIVDDRTIASVYMALLYTEKYPQIFEKKQKEAAVLQETTIRN